MAFVPAMKQISIKNVPEIKNNTLVVRRHKNISHDTNIVVIFNSTKPL